MSEWRLIETAPKDEVIRLWNGKSQGDGYWEIIFEDDLETVRVARWIWCGEGFDVLPPPTHWMPFPEPPPTVDESPTS